VSVRNLDRLLEPASIAVAGASERPGSVGATVWRNLRAGRFGGAIYPLNPKHPSLVGGLFPSLQLPQAPDLAIVCTPPDTVAPLIAAFGELGTSAAIVMTVGLGAARKQVCSMQPAAHAAHPRPEPSSDAAARSHATSATPCPARSPSSRSRERS
jgi:acetyltransferase